MESLQSNLATVQAHIQSASAAAGRSADSVRLIAVTKTIPLDRVREACAAGITDIGENRAQEVMAKFPHLTDVTKHFIGHLQTNKVKVAVAQCDWIHSIDSQKLLDAVSREAGSQGKVMRILLEVSFFDRAGSEHRSGCTPEEALTLIEHARSLPSLDVRGLMTIPLPGRAVPELHHTFRALRQLRDTLQERTGVLLPELSMGMSDDYPIAIAEGATMVRVGRAIFGARS